MTIIFHSIKLPDFVQTESKKNNSFERLLKKTSTHSEGIFTKKAREQVNCTTNTFCSAFVLFLLNKQILADVFWLTSKKRFYRSLINYILLRCLLRKKCGVR